jgi:hypothetical protein
VFEALKLPDLGILLQICIYVVPKICLPDFKIPRIPKNNFQKHVQIVVSYSFLTSEFPETLLSMGFVKIVVLTGASHF